ncbi:hypothetical protein KAR50_06370 [Periweissella fabaria]|uniref:Uncharacterized protein n=1 Tax=Periweissella fabaria TaxID=546157 RepID=A0ABM8Z4E1_9LACO|nr:hypothetical protein [Periweissella fabaria]MCM0597467.1 hypothetical protein [Periweissella fabaria]CAH0416029.1 hypothetical protein WFA24289_00328 [Periweissella fabaria]
MANEFIMNAEGLTLTLPNDLGQLIISDTAPTNGGVTLYFTAHQLIAVGSTTLDKQAFDRTITLVPAWDMEPQYLLAAVTNRAHELGWLASDALYEPIKIPQNYHAPLAEYLTVVEPLLNWLGYAFVQATPVAEAVTPSKKGGKPQHRWQKALSTIPFYVDYAGVTATVYWQKRNEMRLVAGATLVPEAPLNQDGSLGFSARFANTLRAEQAAAISDYQTTQDIILKSPNEVGHFLYFAGTNSWLVLQDANGRTLDDWSVVK